MLPTRFAHPHVVVSFPERARDFYHSQSVQSDSGTNLASFAMHIGNCPARMGEERGVHRVLVGKPEEKRQLGRPRSRWENNIKMDL
jgi:hypothetical protein